MRALLLALLAASTTLPLASGLDVGCLQLPVDEPARVTALGNLGWTPECAIVEPTLGAIFANAGPTAAAVTFDTCEGAASPILRTRDSWSVTFVHDAASGALTLLARGEAFPCERVTGVPEHDITVPWHDAIHGPSFGGRLLVRTH